MGIRFTCPNGHKLNVKPFLSGKRAVCPKCGVKMRVPTESQNTTAISNSDDSRDFIDPRFQGFDPLAGADRQDSANRYNNAGPAHNGEPDFGMFGPDHETGLEDDVLWTEDAPAGSPLADAPTPDTALNEAAFLDDPLVDPRANAALADAALVDPALNEPKQSPRSRGDVKPAKASSAASAPAPPPLRPPVARPAAPGPASGGAGQHGGKAARPKPVLHSMSGPAVDEVIAAAATAPRRPPPAPPNPEDDPVFRFRLQLKRRNRIMMWVSGALALLVLVLAIVLIKVLNGQNVEVSPDVPASTAKEPAAGSKP